ncbi:MAG: hypothetical protein EBY53_07870, partial [Rhodobacteraceae bacterium]|nr:hypothetical protein [Paracoccaceae bacterium]
MISQTSNKTIKYELEKASLGTPFSFWIFTWPKNRFSVEKNREPCMTDDQRGATFMMLSMAAFVLNDTFVKLLGGHI